jgi:hypothetical protein
VKTERRYLWRVIDRGNSRVTKYYLTQEQVMRDYPECTPIPLLETLHVHRGAGDGGRDPRSDPAQAERVRPRRLALG